MLKPIKNNKMGALYWDLTYDVKQVLLIIIINVLTSSNPTAN